MASYVSDCFDGPSSLETILSIFALNPIHPLLTQEIDGASKLTMRSILTRMHFPLRSLHPLRTRLPLCIYLPTPSLVTSSPSC